MLQPYELKYSKIHRAHSFVNYIMLYVVLNAKKLAAAEFSSAVVIPKYKNLIDSPEKKYILDPLKEVYKICKYLSPIHLKALRKAIHHNNRIRELCNGTLEPVRYSDIDRIDKELAKHIKIFCDALYVNCLDLTCFYTQYETTSTYYKHLVGRKLTCHCCGVNKILNKFHAHRSALDHYLPKSIYPFASINFKNLVPICDTCNSKYKLDRDTLEIIANKGKKNETRHRTKAFYPFSRSKHNIDIKINFLRTYDKTIEPKDLEIVFSNAADQEKTDNWDRVFGISDNYKAVCCSDEMGSYYEEYFAALKNRGISLNQHIEDLERNKFYNMNFLKIPFLSAVSA
jgi:hypothetical protein